MLVLLASLGDYRVVPCDALWSLLRLMLCGLRRLLRLRRIQSFNVVPVVCWNGVLPYGGMHIITLLG
jgi:hypothetical protein